MFQEYMRKEVLVQLFIITIEILLKKTPFFKGGECFSRNL